MTETVYPGAAAAFGRGGNVPSPFSWLFTGEDNLRVMVANSKSGVIVTVQGRFLTRKGEIQPFQFNVVPTADRMPSETNVPLGDGYLLNLSAVASAGAPLIGQTYIMIQIIRGFLGATTLLGCLLGGYVTESQHLGYPGSPIESSISGGGAPRVVSGTDPGAGLEWSETVPTGARWEIDTVRATLITAAFVTTRVVNLSITTTAVQNWIGTSVRVQAQSLTYTYFWAGNTQEQAGGAFPNVNNQLPSPNLLIAGAVIGSQTLNLNAADDWGQPFLSVREWLEVG